MKCKITMIIFHFLKIETEDQKQWEFKKQVRLLSMREIPSVKKVAKQQQAAKIPDWTNL